MGLPLGMQRALLKSLDGIYARIPRRRPASEKLKSCRIVSHRGAHDNRTCFENSLAAFDRVLQAGAWGIEFDIRWTRDLHPVVFHDESLQRLFDTSLKVRDLTLAELQSSFAMIPTLRAVIAGYAKKLHLMVELKTECYPDPDYQMTLMREVFRPLEPVADYHFLSLDPKLFKMIHWIPPSAFLPIAEFNLARLSRLSLREGYGGILGHYMLLTEPMVKKHQSHRQKVGTGFVNSKRCLYRELNRGINWIFSDNAVGMQRVCDTS